MCKVGVARGALLSPACGDVCRWRERDRRLLSRNESTEEVGEELGPLRAQVSVELGLPHG